MARTLLARRESATDTVQALFRLTAFALCDLNWSAGQVSAGGGMRSRRGEPSRSLRNPERKKPEADLVRCVIVQRESAATSGENQHPGADQLIADMSGRPGVPGPGSERAGRARLSGAGCEALAAFEAGPKGIHSHWFLSDSAVCPRT
jgi:hypothetical protein